MALSKTVSSAYGFEAIDAYHRVEAISIVGKNTLNFHVRSYVAIDKPFFVEQVLSCPYELDGKNPIKQAYEHLKTMPDFSGATDC